MSDLLIRMKRPNLDDLPQVCVADGYHLMKASEFDDPVPVWIAAINGSFEGHTWTREYVTDNFIAKPQYDPEGVFFTMCGEEAASTAFAWVDEVGETDSGRIHFVGTLPEHGRKGLAAAVVLSVMHCFKARGFSDTFLETQKYRIPAIKLYLKLGLWPILRDPARREEEQAAWDEVAGDLGMEKFVL